MNSRSRHTTAGYRVQRWVVLARRGMACLNVPALRAGWWAYGAVENASQTFPTTGGSSANLRPPPAGLPAEALPGVRAALRARRATCLVRSLVLQRWFASHGDARELVIAVTPPKAGFSAHAWLDGDERCDLDGFVELKRLPAP